MRLLTGLAIVLAGLFYVAWPAWSAYQLKLALESGDVAGVERGIDFSAVRNSLRPAVTAGIEQNLKEATKGTPGSDLIIEKVSKDTLPKLVEASLDTLLTPQSLIRLHAEGKSLREFINSMKTGTPDLAGQVGGFVRDLFGTKTDPAPMPAEIGVSATAAPIVPQSRRLGFGNIKSVGLEGPLGVSIGLSRDAKATAPDLTATLSFEGTGWRVTRLVPRI
jgi:Protein of unknown function (DUF2939)